jgi:copper chaperone CopZ
MKKVIRFVGLECPNCTKKLEEAMCAVEGVESFAANFLTGKLTVEADDARMDAILAILTAEGKKIKPAFELKL